MKPKREVRMTTADVETPTLETREDGSKVLTGYGAVFYRKNDAGTTYSLWDGMEERIAPTAFDRALKDGDDTRGLFNHDPNMLLGRTASGTMRLSTNKRGLKYEIDMPDTTTGRDVEQMINRGDLSGSSFSFSIEKVRWEQTDDLEIRTIEQVRLFDTGPVTFPAYPSTTAGVRSESAVEDIRQERDAWKASIEPEPKPEKKKSFDML